MTKKQTDDGKIINKTYNSVTDDPRRQIDILRTMKRDEDIQNEQVKTIEKNFLI